MKEKLFTIGEVAMITGVNPKSLRYYETIGILQPAHINKQTRYRYYTPQQIDLVAFIQLCVELDIPLKSLQQFKHASTNSIDLLELFAYGKAIAEQKIKKIERSLSFIQSFEADVSQNRQFNDGKRVSYEYMQSHYYYYEQVPEFPEIDSYWQTYQSIIKKLKKKMIQPGYEEGIMIEKIGEKLLWYQFVEVHEHHVSNIPLVHIPAQEVQVKIVGDTELIEPHLEQWLTDMPENATIIFTELVKEVFDHTEMQFKLRILPNVFTNKK
ncbi:MAG: MerR family transcriptional regulator [Culicoidibacterales bacterium]